MQNKSLTPFFVKIIGYENCVPLARRKEPLKKISGYEKYDKLLIFFSNNPFHYFFSFSNTK